MGEPEVVVSSSPDGKAAPTDRIRPTLSAPGFRDLDLSLRDASNFPVRLVVPGDLFLVACPPTTTRSLEPSAGPNAPRSGLRDLGSPPVCALVASIAGNGARHRGVTRRAHVPSETFCFPIDASRRSSCVPALGEDGDCHMEHLSVPLLETPPWWWAETVRSSGTPGLYSGRRCLVVGHLHQYVEVVGQSLDLFGHSPIGNSPVGLGGSPCDVDHRGSSPRHACAR